MQDLSQLEKHIKHTKKENLYLWHFFHILPALGETMNVSSEFRSYFKQC